jgi:hypothetical protein
MKNLVPKENVGYSGASKKDFVSMFAYSAGMMSIVLRYLVANAETGDLKTAAKQRLHRSRLLSAG